MAILPTEVREPSNVDIVGHHYRASMGRTVIHPGEHLAKQLEVLDLSAAELGRQLQVPGNRISQIITGHRAITGDTALRLGHFFGISPQFWLNLQAAYDLLVAEEKTGAMIKQLPTLTGRQKRKADDHATAVRNPCPPAVQQSSNLAPPTRDRTHVT